MTVRGKSVRSFVVARWRHWSLHCLQVWQREVKRKVDAENRQFNKERRETFVYVLPMRGMKQMCLIDNDMVAVVKSSSVTIKALQNNANGTV